MGHASALGSSLALAVADFHAGVTSRRIGILQFAVLTQLIGLVLAGAWTAVSAEPVPPVAALAAAAAGISVTVGLAAFCQAMVIVQISVVLPITAIGVALPVAVGIFRGERPTAAQAVGIAAIAAVVYVSCAPREARTTAHYSGLGRALLAVVARFVPRLIAPASRHGIAWSLLICRAMPAVLLTAAVAVRAYRCI